MIGRKKFNTIKSRSILTGIPLLICLHYINIMNKLNIKKYTQIFIHCFLYIYIDLFFTKFNTAIFVITHNIKVTNPHIIPIFML